MPPAAGIFAEPVAGLHQRRDHRRDVARVDQVVEQHRQVGIGDEVVAVVDDDERIGPLRVVAGRQVDPHPAGLAEGAALDRDLLDPPGGRAARQAPLRPLVAEGAATEFSPNGSPARAGFSGSRIRSSWPLRPIAELVLETPAVLDRQPQQPEVGARRAARRAAGRRRRGSSAPDAPGRPRPARRRSASRARPAGSRCSVRKASTASASGPPIASASQRRMPAADPPAAASSVHVHTRSLLDSARLAQVRFTDMALLVASHAHRARLTARCTLTGWPARIG